MTLRDKPDTGDAGGERLSVYGEKFRFMLELIPHPDGGLWTGAKMERATKGRIAPSYFSTLREGRIEFPRADKVQIIAEAMGFPPELWFKELDWWKKTYYQRYEEGRDVSAALKGEENKPRDISISRLLNRLFEVKVNEETGKPFTDAEVALSGGGEITEEDVRSMRKGNLADPTWAQILALCEAFEVDASYWSEKAVPWRLSPAVLRAAEDPDSYATFQNSLKLSKNNKSMLRALSEHLKREQGETDSE